MIAESTRQSSSGQDNVQPLQFIRTHFPQSLCRCDKPVTFLAGDRFLRERPELSKAIIATERPGKYEVRPAGNAVNLEDEMMKVAGNQMDYQAAISLYSRSMGLFRTALGKR